MCVCVCAACLSVVDRGTEYVHYAYAVPKQMCTASNASIHSSLSVMTPSSNYVTFFVFGCFSFARCVSFSFIDYHFADRTYIYDVHVYRIGISRFISSNALFVFFHFSFVRSHSGYGHLIIGSLRKCGTTAAHSRKYGSSQKQKQNGKKISQK